MRLCLFVLCFSQCLLTALAQPNQPTLIESFKQQLAQAQYDSTRLRICVAIGQQYRDQNQIDSLYVYLQWGMHLLKHVPSAAYASDLYYFQAIYLRHHGLYQQAIQPIRQAISFAQRVKSTRRITKYQYALAVIYLDAGQTTSALSQITTNLNYLRDHDDKPQLMANYLLIIHLFTKLRNMPMRELYVNKYITLLNHSLSTEDLSLAYLLKAELLEEQRHHKQAEAMYKKALYYAYQSRNKVYIIDVLNRQSASFRNHGQYQVAIRSLNQAFGIAQSIHDTTGMAEAKRELAVTLLAFKRKREALYEGRYALKLSRQSKKPISIIVSLEYLGKVLKYNGLYREALNVYQEQHRLKEQTFTKSNVQQIAIMQAEFESKNKEKTIKILQKNAQINQLKVLRQQQKLSQSQRNQLTSAIIISLLFLLIGTVFFFLRRSQQAYAVLQQTAQALSEANEVKNKLFSVIGHDLRSPIASMKITLYQAQTGDAAGLAPIMNRLKRQVDNVLDLLTNLLDWSLIQLKGFDLIQEPIRLYDIVEETISQAGDLLEEKQLGLINQVTKTHVALGNKHQLRAVVRNLLNNAIKFTPTNGYIRLHSVQRETYVELTIRDSGVGMSAEQLACLLSAPEVRTGTMGEVGTGLGLRISRELMERQGGSLHVESWPQGGTMVKIRLPAFEEQVVSQNGVEPVQVGAQRV